MPTTAPAPIDKLAELAGALYTLPSVAVDVLRMTESDSVDARQLTEAIERDPALASKLLRVVNSSLFGLSGAVMDLNQGVAILGVKPLKMLVLTFSLPDQLFAHSSRDALQRYWTVSLTRAVAARAIAVRFPDVSGDEAMLAGLLRGLGQLVLIQQLDDAYANLLEKTAGAPERLAELEHESLGFTHGALTAALMRRWRLPARLALAVEEADPPEEARHGRISRLGQVLTLAELTTRLVLDRRLCALPELLELGDEWCGLTKRALNHAIAPLQEQVDQLAATMSVELNPGLDYQQVLVDAHARLALSVEEAVGALIEQANDQTVEQLLADTHDVRLAMRAFLRGDVAGAEDALKRAEGAHAKPPLVANVTPRVPLAHSARARLCDAVAKAVARCRSDRKELSLVLVHAGGAGEGEAQHDARTAWGALDTAIELRQVDLVARLTLARGLIALVAPGIDRREAVALAHQARALIEEHEGSPPRTRLRAGIASLGLVPNRFEPHRLVDGAVGCLNATMVPGATPVKSIEVY